MERDAATVAVELLAARQDAQGRRLDTVESELGDVNKRLDSIASSTEKLREELAKNTVAVSLMTDAFNGAKTAAYGVIVAVVAAAILVVFGLKGG